MALRQFHNLMSEKHYILYITLHTLHSSPRWHEEYVESEVYAEFFGGNEPTSGAHVGLSELMKSCVFLAAATKLRGSPRLWLAPQPVTGEPAAYFYAPIVRFTLSQLNSRLLTRRRGWCSAHLGLHRCSGVEHPGHRSDRHAGPQTRTPRRFHGCEWCTRPNARFLYDGGHMRHREVIAYIARRLPHQTQREVEEVIDCSVSKFDGQNEGVN